MLATLAPLFTGVVLKDYEELLGVLITFIISMALMVAFGAWWQR